MIYYCIPGSGIYGGIKTACQFVDILQSLGAPACLATPDGRAPRWLSASAPVLDQTTALARLGHEDTLVFSLPQDYAQFRNRPGRLVFHCQGTDPAIDPILRDRTVELLTCWQQAFHYVRERAGRAPRDVGIAVADAFLYDGTRKTPGSVACMPRRGRATIEACMRAAPHLPFRCIEDMDEWQAADVLQSSDFFLATAENEWFGLPALEAMAAGCVVLSVPVLGGMEYLQDGENCVCASAAGLPKALAALADATRTTTRQRLRDRALATAYRYRLSAHRRNVRAWLDAWRVGAP